MSTLHTPHDTHRLSAAERDRRRADLDHDIVAIVAMLAILLLAGLCFAAQSYLWI